MVKIKFSGLAIFSLGIFFLLPANFVYSQTSLCPSGTCDSSCLCKSSSGTTVVTAVDGSGNWNIVNSSGNSYFIPNKTSIEWTSFINACTTSPGIPGLACSLAAACNGNGVCEPALGETTATCLGDCPAAACNNNGFCDAGETCSNCLADCPVSCGDGTCCGETNASCPGDCGASLCIPGHINTSECFAGCDCTGTIPIDCPGICLWLRSCNTGFNYSASPCQNISVACGGSGTPMPFCNNPFYNSYRFVDCDCQ